MQPLSSGHEVIYLEGEELENQIKYFRGFKDGLVRLQPGRRIFPISFLNYANDLVNFKFRKDDVILMTWPKCGTTWMQEIVWAMRTNPDLNRHDAQTNIFNRSPFLELDFLTHLADITPSDEIIELFKNICPYGDMSNGMFMQIAENFPSPRTIKTHLPLSLLGKGLLNTAKVVCVIRDPKDACVSCYHHSRLAKLRDFVGSISDFVDFFIQGDLMYGPYDEFLKEIWNVKEHENMMIIAFENMKQDGFSEVKKLNKFLETNLSDEQLFKILEFTSFENMKKRSLATMDVQTTKSICNLDVLNKEGGFFWKVYVILGRVGSYKDILTPVLEQTLEEWKHEKLLKNGMKFDCPWL